MLVTLLLLLQVFVIVALGLFSNFLELKFEIRRLNILTMAHGLLAMIILSTTDYASCLMASRLLILFTVLILHSTLLELIGTLYPEFRILEDDWVVSGLMWSIYIIAGLLTSTSIEDESCMAIPNSHLSAAILLVVAIEIACISHLYRRSHYSGILTYEIFVIPLYGLIIATVQLLISLSLIPSLVFRVGFGVITNLMLANSCVGFYLITRPLPESQV